LTRRYDRARDQRMKMAVNAPALRSTKATGRPITTDRPGAVVASMRGKAYPTIRVKSGIR